MGYRSEVHVMTSKSGFDKMCEIAWEIADKKNISDEYVLFPKPNSDNQDVFDFYDSDDKYVCFGFDWVKWYEDYQDVALFMDVLIVSNELGVPWMFMRIGEDCTDNETLSSDNFYNSDLPVMYMSVSVSF